MSKVTSPRRSQQGPRLAGAPEITINSVGTFAIGATTSHDMDVAGESRLNVNVTADNLQAGWLVLAMFYTGDTPPSPVDFNDTSKASWLRPIGATKDYEGSVPLVAMGFDAYETNHFMAVIFNPVAMQIEDAASYDLRAKIPNDLKVVIDVDARNSMWFAFAGRKFDANSGYGEKEDGTPATDDNYRCVYRPQLLRVPTGATTCTVALASQDWTHGKQGASYTAGPKGTARVSSLATQAYKSAALGSDKIKDTSQHLVALLYMWYTLNASELEFQPLIAYSAGPLTAPFSGVLPVSTATRLYFAAHDSYEWSNNEKTQHLTITWTK